MIKCKFGDKVKITKEGQCLKCENQILTVIRINQNAYYPVITLSTTNTLEMFTENHIIVVDTTLMPQYERIKLKEHVKKLPNYNLYVNMSKEIR